MLDGEQKAQRHEDLAEAGTTFRKTAPSHPIRDFIVEFFGVLLPGFAFTTGLVLTLVLPLYTLIVSQRGGGVSGGTPTDPQVWAGMEALQLPLLISAAALSYVWGYAFFRLDPRLPDTISYWSLPKDRREGDPVGKCHEQPITEDSPDLHGIEKLLHSLRAIIASWRRTPSSRKQWYVHIWESTDVSWLQEKISERKIARYPRPIEFPYGGLKEWFQNEGMAGLAQFVTWSEQDNGGKTRHLDMMKIALEFTCPEQYSRLAQNEAHVRLVCSIWYATCYSISFSLIGIPVAVLANGLAVPPHSYCLAYPATLLVPVITLFGLVWLKAKIEESLHYIRIREIVYVFAHFRCAREMYPQIMDVLAAQLLEMEGGYRSKPDAAGQGSGEHFAQGSYGTASQPPAARAVNHRPNAATMR
jgi:hypothetical protein